MLKTNCINSIWGPTEGNFVKSKSYRNKLNILIRKCNSQSTDFKSDVEKVKLNIELDVVSLNRVNSTNFWGVIIHENLPWKNYIDAISKTI